MKKLFLSLVALASSSMLLLAQPASIQQPTNQTVTVGGTVNFSVTAGGTPPLSCQWNFNGTNIDWGTNTSLTLTNVQFSQAGNYAVLVTNAYGSILSSNAVLMVTPPPPCAPAPSGLVGWWPGEGDANDVLGLNNGTLMNGVGFAPGEVGQAFSLDGVSSYVSIPDSPLLDSLTSSLTIEAWIRVNQFPDGLWTAIVTKGDSSWRLHRYGNTSKLSFDTDGPGAELVSNGSVDDGQWHHVAAVYDGTHKYLYVDGALDASRPATGFIHQNSYPVCIGGNAEAPGRIWNGLIDEVSIYNRALTASEIQAIYLAGGGGKCLSGSPVFVFQPTNQTVTMCGMATFTVMADGTPPLSYQWNFNGTNIDWGTNTSLTLTNVQVSQAGNYAVLVTNAYGSILSSDALLTVLVFPPSISIQPTNQTVTVGGMATFTVMADGTPPLSYQWNFNGTNIDWGTNTSLTLTNVQFSQAGNYAVLVTNAYGSILSSNAVLMVNPHPPCAPVPTGLVGWWPGEGDANDVLGLNNGTLMNGVGFAPGEVGQAFSLDGVSSYVSIPDSPSLHSLTSSLTIEAWIRVNQFPNGGWTAIVTKGDSSWRLHRYGNTSRLAFDTDGLGAELVSNGSMDDGQWHHVAAVYDGTHKYLYVDGALDASCSATGFIHQNSYPVCIGENAEAPGRIWNGLIDEVSIYNRALTASEIQAIYLAGSWGKCLSGSPVIVFQPTNQTMTARGMATFTVMADGTPPLSYQWNFNGTNIDWGTNTSLTLTNVQFSQAGNYAVLVTNAYGSILSSNAVLMVTPPPPCAPVPAGLVGWWPGEGDANDVLGLNNGTLMNGVGFAPGEVGQAFSLGGVSSYVSIPDSPLLDSLTSSLTIEAWIQVSQFPNGLWTAIVTKGDSSWRLHCYYGTSRLAFDTDGLEAELVSNGSMDDGQWHHVAAVYDGTHKYLYVDGALDASCSATGLISQNSYPVCIGGNAEAPGRIWNGLIDEVSIYNRALTASEIQAIYLAGSSGKCIPQVAPSFLSQPTNQMVTVGSTVNFNVAASGTPHLSYQWNFNGTNLNGATHTSLTLTNVQGSQAGNYTVLVTNAFGSILSSNAVLVVTPDHFAWGHIPSPRFVNIPFAVTIRAQDLTNGIFTNFTGTAILGTTNAVIVTPSVSGNFVQGIWTGAVVISQTASNLVLQAYDGLGHFGLANPINVLNLPSLGMWCSGNIAMFMWPADYSGFVLETSGKLSPASWVVVPYVPFQFGDEYFLPLNMTGTNGFYRLQFPGP